MGIDEHDIATSFRVFAGKGYYLGVKSPWWSRLMEPGENSRVEVNLWKPTTADITLAEKLLFDIMLKLNIEDRKILICRCGRGYLLSYRKCGKKSDQHHEVFRQEFQRVIEKLNKVFDEST